MILKYDFAAIEPKWQKRWEEGKIFAASDRGEKPKFYGLIEFPYPSGQGLHVGHPRPYTAMDIVTRKKRMDGYNVLFPMGFDAFGLPTENYAIKNHIHPAKVTRDNIANFTSQLKMLGFGFDWDRVVDTTDPSYYKWTQWIFLQLYKKGLAYKATMPVNWCTSCKCVLANEEVVEGVCERCGSPVIRKEKSQWMLKITEYAQKLLDGLDEVDFIERVKTQQRNWIGRSTGAEVTFKATTGDDIVVFTTRPDTLFGATYMVLSPEHELVKKWMPLLKNADDIQAYQRAAASKSDLERTELNKEKTGVRLDGVRGVNPVNGREIPIFISDYVLSTYGTGAIMAVPAHDDRDWEFAKKFGCEIIEVVSGGEDVQKAAFTAKDETGILVNSDFLNGLTVKDAIPAVSAVWPGFLSGSICVPIPSHWASCLRSVKCDIVLRSGQLPARRQALRDQLLVHGPGRPVIRDARRGQKVPLDGPVAQHGHGVGALPLQLLPAGGQTVKGVAILRPSDLHLKTAGDVQGGVVDNGPRRPDAARTPSRYAYSCPPVIRHSRISTVSPMVRNPSSASV